MSRLVTVERGAALLDELIPGWEDRIDVDTLDLASPYNCVLGQLHARPNGTEAERWRRYSRGLARLGLDAGSRFGFNVWGRGRYGRLTAAWRESIAARREARR